MVAAGTDGREAERPEERDGPVAAGNGGGASPGLAGLGRVATQLTAVVAGRYAPYPSRAERGRSPLLRSVGRRLVIRSRAAAPDEQEEPRAETGG